MSRTLEDAAARLAEAEADAEKHDHIGFLRRRVSEAQRRQRQQAAEVADAQARHDAASELLDELAHLCAEADAALAPTVQAAVEALTAAMAACQTRNEVIAAAGDQLRSEGLCAVLHGTEFGTGPLGRGDIALRGRRVSIVDPGDLATAIIATSIAEGIDRQHWIADGFARRALTAAATPSGPARSPPGSWRPPNTTASAA